MANEVIIEEYGAFDANIQIPTQWLTTQILDIAEKSVALNANTKYIRIRSKSTGFWYTFGGSDVSAESEAAGNSWVPIDGFVDHKIGAGTYIDTAA